MNFNQLMTDMHVSDTIAKNAGYPDSATVVARFATAHPRIAYYAETANFTTSPRFVAAILRRGYPPSDFSMMECFTLEIPTREEEDAAIRHWMAHQKGSSRQFILDHGGPDNPQMRKFVLAACWADAVRNFFAQLDLWSAKTQSDASGLTARRIAVA